MALRHDTEGPAGTHGPVRPGRRRQEDRRARTRERLLNATLDCLVDVGWSGTSTTEVARRAGVSRGAQQHHYRTKDELVRAAIEHLLQRQRAEYERAFTALPAHRQNIETALDLLWEIYRGPTFTALLELAVVGRTDQTLRTLCADLNRRVVDITVDTFERLFPRAGPPEVTRTATRTALALLAGLALQHGLDDDRYGHQAEVLDHLKAFARRLFPDDAGVLRAGDEGTAREWTG